MKINVRGTSCGPNMTIDFATKNALVGAVTVLFETAWAGRRTPQNAKIARLVLDSWWNLKIFFAAIFPLKSKA
jgi:hypothetical protein